MAFNIMDLFGASALNRLLQPAQSAAGVQNMLLAPQQEFDPARFGGRDRLPAVGMDALRERMSPQGQPGQVAAAPAVDPWAGLREEDVVRVDPVKTASVAPQPARQPFLSDDRRAQLNDFFTGLAMGGTPQESIAYGAKLVAANQGSRKNVNETVKWLQGKGMDEQQAKMIASSPPALNEYLKTLAEGNDPLRTLQLQKAQLEVENLRDPEHGLSADERAYRQDVAEGFKGTRMEWAIKMKEAGRQQVNIDTGEKLPSGFRWKDPNKREMGVEPIPGGPATQIPGELAARVGLSGDFLEQAPALKERIKAGDVTGLVDSNLARQGIGEAGEVYRQLQSGTDALMRLLTGAGMNETEARQYAERYLPTWKDDASSAAAKLDNLVRELGATRDTAMRGRGSPDANAAADPLGIRQ